jgi:hypothetical protein
VVPQTTQEGEKNMFSAKLLVPVEVRYTTNPDSYLDGKRIAKAGETVDVVDISDGFALIAVGTTGGWDDRDVITVPRRNIRKVKSNW